ncbi:uncharacterized protein LOC144630263 isoform X1 [Oculina patagonica]
MKKMFHLLPCVKNCTKNTGEWSIKAMTCKVLKRVPLDRILEINPTRFIRKKTIAGWSKIKLRNFSRTNTINKTLPEGRNERYSSLNEMNFLFQNLILFSWQCSIK